VTGIDPFIDPSSGKTYAMRIKDGARFQDVDFMTLRTVLPELQSSEFRVYLKDDQVVFEGFGKGHGVGLCLFTGNYLAQKGETAPQILGTFFPMTRIVYMRNFIEVDNSDNTHNE
jgi:SpoIID/LytB domain protein